MIAALTLAVAVLAQQETALREKLPEIFARSAAHYRALDAAAARLRTASGASRVPHGFRRETRELDMRPVTWWTAGHFPGSLWYLYEATGDEFFRSRALDWTRVRARCPPESCRKARARSPLSTFPTDVCSIR